MYAFIDTRYYRYEYTEPPEKRYRIDPIFYRPSYLAEHRNDEKFWEHLKNNHPHQNNTNTYGRFYVTCLKELLLT